MQRRRRLQTRITALRELGNQVSLRDEVGRCKAKTSDGAWNGIT